MKELWILASRWNSGFFFLVFPSTISNFYWLQSKPCSIWFGNDIYIHTHWSLFIFIFHFVRVCLCRWWIWDSICILLYMIASSQPITFCTELWLCLWSRLLSFRRYNYCLHGWFLKVPFMVCALPSNLLLVLWCFRSDFKT